MTSPFWKMRPGEMSQKSPSVSRKFVLSLLVDGNFGFVLIKVLVTDDPVQSRLHRAGRNLEWLDKIGADADGHHDWDQNHFAIFPPMRLPRNRRELVKL